MDKLRETVLIELQELWETNKDKYIDQRTKIKEGMRSSQIVCLVDYLIKKGIIKDV